MAKGGGGGVPNSFFKFFLGMGTAFSSFSQEREGAGGWQPPLPLLSKSSPIFLTMKMTFNVNKFSYEVR